MDTAIITPKRRLKDAKDMEIYREYLKLSSIPGSMQTEIKAQLALKYGYGHAKNIYPVIRRVERKMKELEELKNEPALC